MKPAPFEYFAPSTIEAALDLLNQHGDSAKLLAGGQSLVPAMNFRLLQPSALIDLNGIDGFDGIAASEHGVRIGAMARQAALESDKAIAERVPLLSETMPHIAHAQIRNRGTLGGSLVHADPAAELPVVAVALDAEMTLASKSGERVVPAADFFKGMFTTEVGPDEILTEVFWPAQPSSSGWAFRELARRSGDYAMAGVAVLVALATDGTCQSARLVYLNVGDGPVDAKQAAAMLVGEQGGRALFEAAADQAAKHEIMPFGNVHASDEYQRHLARVLTVRALGAAWSKAQNGSA